MSKSEILNWFSGNSASLTVGKILLVLCTALVLSLIIFATYKITYSGVSYNARFNVGNVIITLITAVVMLMIGSNIAISLGMVGALSIVRFRTAIKDPQDTIYLFWSIATGLAVGAGVYQLAVVAVLFIAIVLVGASFYTRMNSKYIIIIRGEADLDKTEVANKLAADFKNVRARAVNNRAESVEMIFEVSAKGGLDVSLVDGLKSVKGVKSANWILEVGEDVG